MLKSGWQVFASDHRAQAYKSICAGLSADEKARLTFVRGLSEDIELPPNADIVWADRSLPDDAERLSLVLQRITGSLRSGGIVFMDLSNHEDISERWMDSFIGDFELHQVQRFADNHFARCMARIDGSASHPGLGAMTIERSEQGL